MMKALIRNEGETITEEMGVPGIDWKNGEPLTNAKWFGGPYTMVQNYVAPVEDEPETYDIIPETNEDEEVTVTEDTVIIDGKEYSKEELRALLGE